MMNRKLFRFAWFAIIAAFVIGCNASPKSDDQSVDLESSNPTTILPGTSSGGTVIEDSVETGNNTVPTPDPITVTFDPGDGAVTPTTMQITTPVYPELPTPTLEGHRFEGWYYNEETLVEEGDDLVIDDDHQLVAAWKELFEVTLSIPAEATFVEAQETTLLLATGDPLVLSDVSMHEATFDGWFYDADDDDDPVTEVFTKEADATIYAQFTTDYQLAGHFSFATGADYSSSGSGYAAKAVYTVGERYVRLNTAQTNTFDYHVPENGRVLTLNCSNHSNYDSLLVFDYVDSGTASSALPKASSDIRRISFSATTYSGDANITFSLVAAPSLDADWVVIETAAQATSSTKQTFTFDLDIGVAIYWKVIAASTASNGNSRFNVSDIKLYTIDSGVAAEYPTVSPATSVEFVDGDALTMGLAETKTLEYTLNPEDSLPFVIWNSSEEGVITINNGVIEAVGVGTSIVTITVFDGTIESPTDQITVTVELGYVAVEEVEVKMTYGRSFIAVGETLQASTAIKPVFATNQVATWSSSDAEVATVDTETGLVTGVALGNVTITATIIDDENTITADYAIFVIDMAEKMFAKDVYESNQYTVSIPNNTNNSYNEKTLTLGVHSNITDEAVSSISVSTLNVTEKNDGAVGAARGLHCVSQNKDSDRQGADKGYIEFPAKKYQRMSFNARRYNTSGEVSLVRLQAKIEGVWTPITFGEASPMEFTPISFTENTDTDVYTAIFDFAEATEIRFVWDTTDANSNSGIFNLFYLSYSLND